MCVCLCFYVYTYIPYKYIKASGMSSTCFKLKTFSIWRIISLESHWNLMNTLEQVNKFGCTYLENLLSNYASLNFIWLSIFKYIVIKASMLQFDSYYLCMLNIIESLCRFYSSFYYCLFHFTL